MGQRGAATQSDDGTRRFARDVVRGLAALPPTERRDRELLFLLHLSTWIAQARIDLPTACQTLIGVREALIRAGGMDGRREPVPLVVGDLRVAVASVAVYVGDLIDRAAATVACTPKAMATKSLRFL